MVEVDLPATHCAPHAAMDTEAKVTDWLDLQMAAPVKWFRGAPSARPTAAGECLGRRDNLRFESERSVVEGRPK